jgi:hypothetical protein
MEFLTNTGGPGGGRAPPEPARSRSAPRRRTTGLTPGYRPLGGRARRGPTPPVPVNSLVCRDQTALTAPSDGRFGKIPSSDLLLLSRRTATSLMIGLWTFVRAGTSVAALVRQRAAVAVRRRRSRSWSARRAGSTTMRSRISFAAALSSASAFGSSGSPPRSRPATARTKPSFR